MISVCTPPPPYPFLCCRVRTMLLSGTWASTFLTAVAGGAAVGAAAVGAAVVGLSGQLFAAGQEAFGVRVQRLPWRLGRACFLFNPRCSPQCSFAYCASFVAGVMPCIYFPPLASCLDTALAAVFRQHARQLSRARNENPGSVSGRGCSCKTRGTSCCEQRKCTSS